MLMAIAGNMSESERFKEILEKLIVNYMISGRFFLFRFMLAILEELQMQLLQRCHRFDCKQGHS